MRGLPLTSALCGKERRQLRRQHLDDAVQPLVDLVQCLRHCPCHCLAAIMWRQAVPPVVILQLIQQLLASDPAIVRMQQFDVFVLSAERSCEGLAVQSCSRGL